MSQEIPDDTEWVRVRQPETGHEFDRHRTQDFTGFEVLKDYPPNNGREPRPQKYRTEKDGTPSRRAARPTSSGE